MSSGTRVFRYISAHRILVALITLSFLFAPTAPVAGAPPAAPYEQQIAWPVLEREVVAGGLFYPVSIDSAQDGTNRLFVVEQAGRVRIIKEGVLLATPFLDITDRVSLCDFGCEMGLFSIAFPPLDKSRFYVTYTAIREGGRSILSRFRVDPLNPDRALPDSEESLLTIVNPYGMFGNHNGGQIAFSPVDGYLYWGVGDSDGQEDPNNVAQNLGLLTGKILRLNVECCIGRTPAYEVPPDNPFVNRPGARGEIWSYGLRNPWRFSFDRSTGDLYIADVGQFEHEEIDVQLPDSVGGQNYGWRVMEGRNCFNSLTCDSTGMVLPAITYEHDPTCSVTGGHVVRGPNAGAMNGLYFFADFCTSQIWAMQQVNCVWMTEMVMEGPGQIVAFGLDERGDLYFADHVSGTIHRIKATSTFNPTVRLVLGPYHLSVPAAYGPPTALKPLEPTRLCPPQIAGQNGQAPANVR